MSSSVLGKRKDYIDKQSNNIPLVKKQKIYSSFLNYKQNYSFPSLICCDTHFNNNCISLCINDEKKLFSFGYSTYSCHGHEDDNIFSFKQIQRLTNIKMVSCAGFHSICLGYEGDVFSFGSNYCGQLGIGKDKNELKQTHIPQKINIPSCKQVSCASNFSICLTEDNLLYSFGYNGAGQLGLGNNNNYNSPQLIPNFDNIEYIVCGGYYSICKTYNNEIYSWGNNSSGQLGQGNNDNCNKPIQCLNWPDNIISIKSGDFYSLLLTSEGQIYSFGDNESGQLGIDDENIESINIPTLIEDIPEIQRIECGYYHSICIDINNNLWLFGDNCYGQLGLGDKEDRYKPILHPTLSNIIDISSGGLHTFIKTIDNKIYAFGSNCNSQLGIDRKGKNNKDQITPIQVLINNEDMWYSKIGKSKQKSARK